jgi:hypothetical protein
VKETTEAPTEEKKKSDDKGSYEFSECTKAIRDCDLDTDCKKVILLGIIIFSYVLITK